MPKPQHHIFICGQTRAEGHPRGSCGASGAAAIFQSFAGQLTRRKLLDKISITQTSCLGPCQTGANVLVYPSGVMYASVQPEDVETIVDQHLLNGEPVAEKLAPAELW